MNAAPFAIAMALGALAAACGGATTSAETAGSRPAIASVHRAKCGACHAPPDPGTRSRGTLESAFERHKSQARVRLSDAQWSAMVDYLAAPGGPVHVNANADANTVGGAR